MCHSSYAIYLNFNGLVNPTGSRVRPRLPNKGVSCLASDSVYLVIACSFQYHSLIVKNEKYAWADSNCVKKCDSTAVLLSFEIAHFCDCSKYSIFFKRDHTLCYFSS
jgi:hypothetical protein